MLRVSAALCVWVPVLVVCVASQAPGVTLDGSAYWDWAADAMHGSLDAGWASALHVSKQQAGLLSVFPFAICSLCFMWASAKQMQALTNVNLLPDLLKERNEDDTPTRAIICTVLLGLLISLVCGLALLMGVLPIYISGIMLSIQELTLCFVCISVLVAYIAFRTRGIGEEPESFKNPLGRVGPAFGVLIFLLIVPLQHWAMVRTMTAHQSAVTANIGYGFVGYYLVATSVYYFTVARKAQTITQACMTAFLPVRTVRGEATVNTTTPADCERS